MFAGKIGTTKTTRSKLQFTHTYKTHKFIIENIWFLPVKGSTTENKIRSLCLKKRNIHSSGMQNEQ